MSRLECIVGGVAFATTVEILTSVPGSFFSNALNDTWNSSGSTTLTINRDGTYFQHVLSYLIYGYLPRDPAGRCNISKEVLELLSVEADFYGLPLLGKEIDQLLQFNMKGMRYFISSFYLDSGPSGGLTLEEFATYEEALAKYEQHKKDSKSQCLKKERDEDEDEGSDNETGEEIDLDKHQSKRQKTSPGNDGDESEYECEVDGDRRVYRTDESGQDIVVEETSDLVTGKIVKQVFEDGSWKRPSGVELLCVPISGDGEKDRAMYSCYVRTHPDNREYY